MQHKQVACDEHAVHSSLCWLHTSTAAMTQRSDQFLVRAINDDHFLCFEFKMRCLRWGSFLMRRDREACHTHTEQMMCWVHTLREPSLAGPWGLSGQMFYTACLLGFWPQWPITGHIYHAMTKFTNTTTPSRVCDTFIRSVCCSSRATSLIFKLEFHTQSH